MLPDTGERYLSTPLFEDIREEMNEAEMEISRSTPGYRFDIKTPSDPSAEAEAEPVAVLTGKAESFVNQVLADDENPVVLFALEWCEFCWSLRKLFAKLGISYRSIDLDSVEYQAEDLGGQIRAVLNDRVGSNTIPQFFIAGEHIGGATDTFDAFKAGELQSRLAKLGIETEDLGDMDPYELLPNWLHKR